MRITSLLVSLQTLIIALTSAVYIPYFVQVLPRLYTTTRRDYQPPNAAGDTPRVTNVGHIQPHSTTCDTPGTTQVCLSDDASSKNSNSTASSSSRAGAGSVVATGWTLALAAGFLLI
ncbi:uncharacterized protein LODBEIA_P51840 [Lodderomyces beijingensis]|uniref:Uncharacterized protein n=1 Tax=Lodderomyces beijingensis TaxID=1775926 RepID=A0ABP0ZS43_9ASCO